MTCPRPGKQEQEQPKLPPTRPPESRKPFVPKVAVVTASGIRYVDRADYVPDPEPVKPKKQRAY